MYTVYRPNSFQVRSRDGMSKVNLHCDDDTPDQLHDWTTAISKRIGELNRSEVYIMYTSLVPRIQFSITCSMENQTVGRPGNEASMYPDCCLEV